ncbi:MAG TPA: putative glycoside hydrolase [Thermoanaerobaculia bacterium]|nr:putative glycoside hydrolase [Thermoanaerobaculia bacterium]
METYLDPNDRFRQRRAQARRRRRLQRTVGAIALLLAAAAIAVGAGALPDRSERASDTGEREAAKKAAPKRTGPPVPKEIRGVHVTMALASIDGKLQEYTKMPGLNAIELDVKDENGEVAFHGLAPPLAKRVGAAMRYYDPVKVAKQVHAEGLFLIGRVVCFEDPYLSRGRPDLAIQTSGGGIWRNHAGLGWTNPYDKRVWDYNLRIAQAAAKAGFDEIQFDYVRFPSDGDIESAVFPGKRNEPMGITIAKFVHYAASRLKPMGVRVSVDVFGLSATRDLGIGQSPRRLSKIVDAIYPMVYPSHYGSGEYGLDSPVSVPGRTVGRSLRDFRRQMRRGKAQLVPWLEDFSFTGTTTLAHVQEQIRAARRWKAGGFLLWNPSGVYTEGALTSQ